MKPSAVKGEFTQVSAAAQAPTDTPKAGAITHHHSGACVDVPEGPQLDDNKENHPPQPDGVVPKPCAAHKGRANQTKSQEPTCRCLTSAGL